jgi:hypothetical protein
MMMKPQNELALIVAYYLSRFDKQGYINLGYKNFDEATKQIGHILDVNPNTVKNMRDEFDPYHENSRIGWKRELRGSRQKVITAFQNTDDNTIRDIVEEILFNKKFIGSQEYIDIRTLFSSDQKPFVSEERVFIPRGITGKSAELIYLEHFKNTKQPCDGEIIDRREQGCGYDFEIKADGGSHFIEVKGLAKEDGAILFTSKEWSTATIYKDKYYLVLIKNISDDPIIHIIQNPTMRMEAKKKIFPTIQVNWIISQRELKSLL